MTSYGLMGYGPYGYAIQSNGNCSPVRDGHARDLYSIFLTPGSGV